MRPCPQTPASPVSFVTRASGPTYVSWLVCASNAPARQRDLHDRVSDSLSHTIHHSTLATTWWHARAAACECAARLAGYSKRGRRQGARRVVSSALGGRPRSCCSARGISPKSWVCSSMVGGRLWSRRALRPRLIGCLAVQDHLARSGFPCPAPLTGVTRLGGLAVTAETSMPGGGRLSPESGAAPLRLSSPASSTQRPTHREHRHSRHHRRGRGGTTQGHGCGRTRTMRAVTSTP